MRRIVPSLLFLLALLAIIWLPLHQARTVGDAVINTQSVLEQPVVMKSATQAGVDPAGQTVEPRVAMTSTPIQPSSTPPAPTSTPEWTWNPAGNVVVPILLYHHITEKVPASRYFVSPGDFEMQVSSLQRWGYTSISLSLLLQALTEGAYLPPKPVVITFDDGYRDVYTHALPILQRYGFTGVVYMIAGEVGVGKYLNVDELGSMASAGWEIGSHSWTHTSLRSPTVKLPREIDESRQTLEGLLGVPVQTFAFPYGLTSKYVTDLVKDAGYTTAVGLGGSFRHTKKTRYYLSRIEVRGNYDLKRFASLLPWSGDLGDSTPPSNDQARRGDGQ